MILSAPPTRTAAVKLPVPQPEDDHVREPDRAAGEQDPVHSVDRHLRGERDERPPAQALWFPRWLKPLLPNAVRIEMAPLEPSSSKLEPVTVTIPVRVNREPMSQYAN